METIEKKPVTREDLLEFHFLSEVSLSPDGRRAAYVVSRADREKNGYQNSLWVMDLETGDNRMAASRGGAGNPVWLDGENLLFVSGRECEPRYYKISMKGGEAVPFMTVPVKAGKLMPLGDGTYLLEAQAEEREKAPEPPKTEEEYAAKEGEDYEIYEELPFWYNGKGVRSRKRNALFLFHSEESALERLTEPYLDVTSFDLSAGKKLVAYCGPSYDSVRPRTSALYVRDLESGQTRQLTGADLYEIGNICFLGDTRIFYTGTTYERVGRHPRFYIYDLETGSTRQLPFADTSIGNSVGSDAKYGGGKSIAYCETTDELYMIRTCLNDSQIVAMDCEGRFRTLSREPGAVTGFDAAGGTLIMTAMRGQRLAELYALFAGTGEEKRLTGFNDAYLAGHRVSEPEHFQYESKNGYLMEGFVIPPAGYQEGKAYPAVLEIHGGPKSTFGSVFFHEMQCLANDGYFVLYTNPRGSNGRSEAFADITEVFGKDDFEDLMEFTDQALARYPDIDPKRVGVCGGSYGGFMCNWIVGHTDRYAAAVSQRSISNYLTKCLYTDIGYYANRLQMGAYPWEDFHKVWSMSPLSAAAHVKTPLLLLQSDEDYRCWMGDAVQMFSAVKRTGTDTRMVLFHGENHELSRSGKPENRLTRLMELEQWFENYLKS